MRFITAITLLLTTLASLNTAAAEIYRWKDRNGKVHYSDTPPSAIMPQAGSTLEQREQAAKIQKEFQTDRGRVVLRKVEGGEFVQYRAKSYRVGGPVLVLAHGRLDDRLAEEQAVANFLSQWQAFAEAKGLLLLAPIFSDANFAVKSDGPQQFGYRGLFGRFINADEFVLQILAYYQDNIQGFNSNFLIAGIESGAQFANRFVIAHPEKVSGAVLVQTDWFAFPEAQAQWPNGMAPRYRMVKWPGKKDKNIVKVELQSKDWLLASQVKTAVVVGADDTTLLTPHPEIAEFSWSQNVSGVSNAQRWVSDMRNLAKEYGVDHTIYLHRVNGVARDLPALQNKAQEAISELL